MLKRARTARTAVSLVALVALGVAPVSPAAAATSEPALTDLAWFWEDSEAQDVDTPAGKVTVETPNPFCPTAPGSVGSVEETCASERLPVWIKGGDYETPYMVSAVGFDLALVPIGSKVEKFTVTLLEDEANCEKGDTSSGQQCRHTDPVNIAGHKLQACVVGGLFGSGEGRPYREVPDYSCSPTDPIATRKKIKAVDKNDDDGDDHIWTFDLTRFASRWIEEFSAVTGIVITAQAPKNYQPANPDGSDNWRVVLAGPNVNKGVRTKLVYTPGEGGDEFFDFGDIGTTGSTGTTSFGGGDLGSAGGDFGGDAGGIGTAPGEEPAEAPPEDLALEEQGAEGDEQASMPGYVWLAILVGLLAFSLVRQAVLERVGGIRSDGPLAQIRKLNAARRGGAVAAAGDAGPLATVGAAARSVGAAVTTAFGKIRSIAKRG